MLQKIRKLKLHTIISLFIIIIIGFIIAVLGMLSLSLFKNETLESFADSRQDTLLQISEDVTEYCEKIELLSDSYADIKFIQQQALLSPDDIDLDAFKTKIDGIKEQMDASFFFPEIEYELQVICDNGLYYSSVEDHNATLLELPGTLWFYRAEKENADSIWQSNISFKNEEGKTDVISLVRFLKDEKGKNHAAILINLDERQLYRIYARIIGFQSTIYLVDTNGQIASHPTLSMVGRFFYDMNIFNAFFEDSDWAQIVKSEKEYLFSKYDSPDNPWIVVEEIPMSVITDPLEQVTRTINILTVILLLFSVIVAVFFSQKVSAPFERLSDSMDIAGKGDLSVTFPDSVCSESSKMAKSSQKFVSRIKSLIDELKLREMEKRKSELEFLQMQINPHFMYNTLFTIRCMVEMGLQQDASEMLERFSNMLSKVLRIDSPMLSILDNIDYLEDYCSIMKHRFGELSFFYEIEEGLERTKMLKFILQPLVENSIHHGFPDGITSESSIRITVSRFADEFIEIHVIDNGCGMDEETVKNALDEHHLKSGTHIGLVNVKMKLRLYYSKKAIFSIDTGINKGTDIRIIIPKVES
ncbi:MAG: histidine kinase [Sphaerochaetaceae bacterium]|nr:histidine kinase [Sphaerochaetaceae bacterium]